MNDDYAAGGQFSSHPEGGASPNGLLGASALTGAIIGVALAGSFVVANVIASGAGSPLDVLNGLATSVILLFPYLLVLLVPLLTLAGLLTAVTLRRRLRSMRFRTSFLAYAVTFAAFGTVAIALNFPVLAGIVRSPLSLHTWLGGLALSFSILFGLGSLAGTRVLSRCGALPRAEP